MSRLFGILSAIAVVLLAMGFAASNSGYRATIDLGLFTLYQVPVTLVAFSGLMVGMVVMFATGIHTDLKVRRILRERLAEEAHSEQMRIDGAQRDLFLEDEEETSYTLPPPLARPSPEPEVILPNPEPGPDSVSRRIPEPAAIFPIPEQEPDQLPPSDDEETRTE